MKTYFAYVRVSTVRQGEHGSSLQEQKAAIETYAARNGLHISVWFEERVTAAKQGRREFARLTAQLRAGKAQGVIIHKIDRSARNLKDWAGLGELIDAGIEVLFAHEALDLQTRGGRLAADIQAVVAADFIRNLREEVRKGLYGRLKQGFYPLAAPRGYLDRGKARVKDICPRQGPLVRQMFELYATGAYSLELLRHEMARRGLTDRSNQPLSFKSLSIILRNPFYVGLMRIRSTGDVFEGKHVPLVAKAVFDRVQTIMDGRLYPRTEKHLFLFRRLLKCSRCGRSLSGERQRAGRIYYRCHDRACRGVCVAEPAVDAAVRSCLRELALDEGDLGDLRDLLRKQVAKGRQAASDRETRLTAELNRLAQRLVRLTDVLLDGMIDRDTFAERKEALLHKRREIHDRLDGHDGLTFWEDVAKRFEQASAAYSGYDTATPDEKRAMVKLLGSNMIVDRKKPAIRLHFPYSAIQEWNLAARGAHHGGAVRTEDAGGMLARGSKAPVSALIELLARHENVSLQ
jgi:DNA invertase Pin-like site-specific DNA recombinase